VTNSLPLSGNDDVMTEVQIRLASDGASRLTRSFSGNDDVMAEIRLASDGASRLTRSLSLSGQVFHYHPHSCPHCGDDFRNDDDCRKCVVDPRCGYCEAEGNDDVMYHLNTI